MYTLTIPQIFSNLDFYQENYLNILNSAESYFTDVEGAFVDLFPFKKQNLYLGDLLQLWFSEKWSDDATKTFQLEEYLAANDVKKSAKQHVYIFAIQGNAVTGVNKSQSWALVDSKVETLALRSPLKYYVELVNCARPKAFSPVEQASKSQPHSGLPHS